MERRWFGTDGVRGRVGTEPMTVDFVRALGRAAGCYFAERSPQGSVIVARDTRESGPQLEAAICAGLREAGLSVESIGVIPSGAAAMVVLEKRACAGVILSASHNPASDNGVKFCGADGAKLSDEVEAEIERRLDLKKGGGGMGKRVELDFSCSEEALGLYRGRLERVFGAGKILQGMKILVDVANGAAWMTTPKILREMGAEVEVMAGQPNGVNINEGCGSEHPEKLMEVMNGRKGWVGLAHDGDADRMVLIDEEGERVDGDEVIAMAALDAMERGALKGKTVVVTQMSNLGLDEAVKARGGSVVRTAVGDRHVAEAMRKGGFVVGGEQSGHLLFHDAAPTGDGLLSALKIFSSMMRKKVGLAELRKGMKRYPQKLLNLRVRHKPAWETVAPLAQAVREMEQVLGKRGRILLRYSGTENLVRLLVEADKMDTIDRVVDRLMPILQEHLGEK